LTVSGEVDLDTADEFADHGLECLNGAGSTLVIDLGGVTFMDSTGLGALVRIHNAAQAMDKSIVLTNIPERVQTLLHITKLDGVFGS